MDVKITSGSLLNRHIIIDDKLSVRPMMGVVRGVIWNWLRSEIVDKFVLDACAGTGVLSFEAISNGAKKVIAIDGDDDVLFYLSKHAIKFDAKVDILKHKWPLALEIDDVFDFIFWDPPYDAGWRYQAFKLLDPLLSLKGSLFISCRRDDVYEDNNWVLIKKKSVCNTDLLWFKRK